MAEAGLDLEHDVEIIMAGDARIQVLINDDVDAMGGGNKDWDAVRVQDPDTEYRLLAQTDTLPGEDAAEIVPDPLGRHAATPEC